MGSHFAEARRNDPEVAAAVAAVGAADSGQELPPWRPRGEDVSLTVELLMRVLDRLEGLTAIELSRPLPKGAKQQKPGPAFPRPVREVDRARARADEEYLESLDDDVAQAQDRWDAAHPDDHDDEPLGVSR